MDKVPIILHDNLQCESHKPHGFPAINHMTAAVRKL